MKAFGGGAAYWCCCCSCCCWWAELAAGGGANDEGGGGAYVWAGIVGGIDVTGGAGPERSIHSITVVHPLSPQIL